MARTKVELDTRELTRTLWNTQQQFIRLEVKVQKRVLRKAANAGASIIVRNMKAEAPRINNGLRKSITKKVKTYKGNVTAVVGQDTKKRGRQTGRKRFKGGGITGSGNVVPDHLVNNKVRPHRIRVKRATAMTYSEGRGRGVTRYYFTKMRHKGHRGVDYMRSTHTTYSSLAVRTMENKFIVELSSELSAMETKK